MKYKLGDKVRVKSLEWYNENKTESGYMLAGDIPFVEAMTIYCNQVLTISEICGNGYHTRETECRFYWTDDMFEGLVESNELNKVQSNEQSFKVVDDVDYVKPVVFENIVFPNENYADKVELCLGDDYEIVVENGRTFVQRKKPKYPTIYEECCDVLKIPKDERYIDIDVPLSYNVLLYKFTQLLICRYAYWKIAGEEMGLGKYWEPDWTKSDYKFCLVNMKNKIAYDDSYYISKFLAFPTEEMRDAFYKNFKNLIEDCKKLL